MEDLNLSFLLYFVDERSPLEIKERLEVILGAPFHIEEVDAPLEERQGSFQGTVLGMDVLLRLFYEWPEGNAYKLNGVVNKHLYSVGGQNQSITSHMLKLLQGSGFKSVMSREAFVLLCERKGL